MWDSYKLFLRIEMTDWVAAFWLSLSLFFFPTAQRAEAGISVVNCTVCEVS